MSLDHIATVGGSTVQNWEDRSLTLGWLRRQAFHATHAKGAFGWLKSIGVVPEEVMTRRVVPVRLDLDPTRIQAGYLASCAYEWDSWGPSTPTEFVEAIGAETAGERRDLVAGLLTLLGRELVAA